MGKGGGVVRGWGEVGGGRGEGKGVGGRWHHLAYLIAISNYSFKSQNSLYMDTHSLDTDTFL